MLQLFAYFVMVPMVYLAFFILIIGIIYKLAVVFRSPRIKGSLGLFPADMPVAAGVLKDAFFVPVAFRRDRVFWAFIVLFHAFFLFLFLGHLELVWDIRVLQIVPHRIFLGAGVIGITLLIATLYFLFRRLGTPHREISVPEDFILLLILFLSIAFGSILHLAERFGIGALQVPVGEYRSYFMSLLAFSPKLPVMVSHSPHYAVMVIHIFFSNLFIMLFPFSKMIHSVFAFFSFSIARKTSHGKE